MNQINESEQLYNKGYKAGSIQILNYLLYILECTPELTQSEIMKIIYDIKKEQ